MESYNNMTHENPEKAFADMSSLVIEAYSGKLITKVISSGIVQKVVKKVKNVINLRKLDKGLDVVDNFVVKTKNTYGGNVTVMKNGNPVFRVHQPGTHGNVHSTLTKFRQGVNPNNGRVFNIPSKKVIAFTSDDLNILKKAINNSDGYSITTRGKK